MRRCGLRSVIRWSADFAGSDYRPVVLSNTKANGGEVSLFASGIALGHQVLTITISLSSSASSTSSDANSNTMQLQCVPCPSNMIRVNFM